MGFKIRLNELREYISEDGETKIIIPEGVKSIGNNAFSFQSHITDVVFPESLRSIGIKAFYRCTGLTDINLPYGVKKINEYSFAGTRLQHISIPASVEYIHNHTFNYGENPQSITIKGRNIQVKIPVVPPVTSFGFYVEDDIYKFINSDLSEKENMLTKKLFSRFLYMHLAIFIAFEYGSETGWKLMEENKYPALRRILNNTYENDNAVIEFIKKCIFTEKDIDELIQHANNNKRYELQIMLSRFRQDNLGSAFDSFDKFFI